MSDGFLRRRVLAPILAQLRQGVSPEKLALSVALGAVIGIFPLIGVTTAIGVFVGYRFRLNHFSLQMVNHLMWPLQLPMVLVFVRLGEKLFRADAVPLMPAALAQEFIAGPLPFLKNYGLAGVHGVTAWALVAPFFALALYAAMLPLFRRAAAYRGRWGGA